MKLRWLAAAIADLRAIKAYIAEVGRPQGQHRIFSAAPSACQRGNSRADIE